MTEFVVIERMQKRRDHKELYTEWNDIIRERLQVTTMEGQQMRDFKGTLAKYYKPNAKDWKIKYKVSNYNVKNKLNIVIYEDMNAMLEQKFHLLKWSYTKVAHPTAILYSDPCSVNSKKVKNVQSLARYLLREKSRDYLKALIGKTPGSKADEDSNYDE